MHNKENKKVFEDILKELWKIRNPHLKFDASSFQSLVDSQMPYHKKAKENGVTVSEKAFFELVTSRNRNLILPLEQKSLRESNIAFFGLSVGSHAAVSWMMLSRALKVAFIDPDTIDATNLNRIVSGWDDIGRYKVDVLIDKIKSICPFCDISKFYKADKNEIDTIFRGAKISAIVDEIDDFEDKVLLRKYAKEYKIPLVSAADVGDNIILDIERYDSQPNTLPFLGRVKNPENIKFNKLTAKQKKKLIIQLVGFEANSERMIDSLIGIEGSIVSWPQLGSTAQIAGGIIAKTLKDILLGLDIKSGRYYFDLDKMLGIVESNISRKEKKIKKINELLEET